MEQLEGQYFEKTISSLKQAKAREQIEIRPEFKAQLRVALENRIAMQMDEPVSNGVNWAETVLRFKYLFAGVPVLAVLVIVATNFNNWQVKIPNQQIVPVVNQESISPKQSSQSNLVDIDSLPNKINTLDGIDLNPKIVTFSADSVMPPADVLNQSRQNYSEQTPQSENAPEVFSKQLEQSSPEVKLTTPDISIYNFTTNDASQIVEGALPVSNNNATFVQENPVITFAFPESDQNNNISASNLNNQDLAPTELNGRVEDHGIVQTTAPATAAGDSAGSLPVVEQSSVENVTPLEVQQSVQESTEPQQPQAMAMKIASPVIVQDSSAETYIDSAQERTQLPVANSDLRVDAFAATSMVPVFLEPSRIYFKGEERERVNVVNALMDGLAKDNGSLSSDYYINVIKVKDGQFKAVLFEYGQVKKVLILGFREGKLVVLTQINY